MPGPPMRCDTCRFRFPMDYSGSLPFGNGTITFHNDTTTCPNCGGRARQVRSGTYQMLQDGSLKQLAATLTNRGATKSDFEKLAELLQEALRTNAPPTQVAATIHTETPFSGLGDALLSTKGVAVATWLTVVLTVVVLIIPSLAKDPRLW